MAKKWTHEMFVDFVDKETEGFEVVGQYINNETKILMKHNECGREFLVRPADFKRRKRCSPCNRNERKTTEEYKTQVKELSNDKYEVLEEYKNDYTKLLTRHKECGFTWKASPTHFIQGKRCPKCAGNIKKTTSEFDQEIKELTNGEYVLLSDYEHSHLKVKVRHRSSRCKNNEFLMTPTDFLSGKRCPKCATLNASGENHWKYNPNLTEEDRARRDMFNGELRKWRDKVYQRDNYICQICLEHSHDLNAHHLNSWDKFENERFLINNGVTLCKDCHCDFHSKYGYGNNTKQQFNEYKALL